MKTVLITGAGTGFGHEAAVRSLAGLRHPDGRPLRRGRHLPQSRAEIDARGDEGHIDSVWTKKIRDGLGTRLPALQKSFEMQPETPVSA